MSRVPPLARGLIAIAIVALAIVLLNAEVALVTAGLLLRIAFVVVAGLVAYFWWRDLGRREIETWGDRQQRVFYGAAALAVIDLVWFSLYSLQGLDALVFFLVAGVCVYALVRTWRGQRTYG